MPESARERILVVGGSGVDTIVRVERLAVPPGDSVSVEPIRDYVAHTGTGYALAFHALGRPTTFLDFLGDDDPGRLVRDRFAATGVDFVTLPAPAGTPRSVNLVDAEGRRFSFYDGRHPAGLTLPLDIALPLVDRARHVHVGRSDFNRELLTALADRPDVTTSTDVHAWDGVDPAAHPWVFGVDHVFLSAASIQGRAPEVLRMILARGRARLVVATDGAAGCYLLAGPEAGGDGEVRHFPAVTPPGPVVDSNGAGDSFATAFLHTLLDGAPLARCVHAGLLAGAFATTHHGTHERHITAGELAGELAAATARATPGPRSGPASPRSS
ncbi:carbohydrate kinase family protein [Streptomyces sp. NBRC 109706]|uniref:carbohydrate kinase family protein n=1 Tax=Streptomyces sp. NBRC 109706 TaxID=1550035 RepID=UPI00082F590A|nr:carbohydrate kinase family protein [Streptomyces sp. NBRC 109706]